eukprot:scaffold244476_cov45-Prasinocladus_malaysianus.AAC.1
MEDARQPHLKTLPFLTPAVCFQLSPELCELCRLQLYLLTTVVQQGLPSMTISIAPPGLESEPASEQHIHEEGKGGVVATVYARCPSSFETGRLELEQIASCGPAAA